MSEDNSWKTAMPSSSTTNPSEQSVVRPDTLNIGNTAISMDLLTPQLLQFLQKCQPGQDSATPPSDSKILDGFLPQLTRTFTEGRNTSLENTTAVAASTNVPSSVIPQNSFLISSGPTDSSTNQKYILISSIGTATTAVSSATLLTSPTAVLQNTNVPSILNDPALKMTHHTSTDMKEPDLLQVLPSSVSLQDTGIRDSDRPTRPSSSSGSSFLGEAVSTGRRRYSDLASRPGGMDDSVTMQLNRLEQKRARNRDAARRCRERKIRLIDTLEKKVLQLSDNNRQLKRELEQTQSEVECLRQFVEQHFKPPAAGGCTVPLKG